MSKRRIIIGVTGYIAAGKGTFTDILKNEFGFAYSAFVDRVRELAAMQFKELTRENLQYTGNHTQKLFGPDVFARLIAAQIWAEQKEKVVVECIRNPQEYAFLAQHPDFFMVAVTAPLAVRFARLQARNREGDPKTLQEFFVVDQRDRGIGQDLSGQQVDRCIGLAEFKFENSSTKEEFETQVRDFIKLLQG